MGIGTDHCLGEMGSVGGWWGGGYAVGSQCCRFEGNWEDTNQVNLHHKLLRSRS